MEKQNNCQKCGHGWNPIKEEPEVCPSCKTQAWDTPLTLRQAVKIAEEWRKKNPKVFYKSNDKNQSKGGNR